MKHADGTGQQVDWQILLIGVVATLLVVFCLAGFGYTYLDSSASPADRMTVIVALLALAVATCSLLLGARFRSVDHRGGGDGTGFLRAPIVVVTSGDDAVNLVVGPDRLALTTGGERRTEVGVPSGQALP